MTFLDCSIGALACLPLAPDLLVEASRASAGALGGLVLLAWCPPRWR